MKRRSALVLIGTIGVSGCLRLSEQQAADADQTGENPTRRNTEARATTAERTGESSPTDSGPEPESPTDTGPETESPTDSGPETATEAATERSDRTASEFEIESVREHDLKGVFTVREAVVGTAFSKLVRIDKTGERTWQSSNIADDYTIGWTDLPSEVSFGDESVIAGASGSDADNARVYAFDASSGETQWFHDTPDDGLHDEIRSVDSDGTTVVYGSTTGGNGSDQEPIVRALDRKTGTEKWIQQYSEDFVEDTIIKDGKVYVVFVGSKHGTPVLDLETGAQLEEYEWGGGFRPTTRHEDIVYATNNFGKVTCFDLEAEKKRWEISSEYDWNTRPAVHAGTIVIGSDNGYVVAYQQETGDQLWETRVRSGLRYLPMITDDAVWVCDELGFLFALSVADGEPILKQEITDSGGAVAVLGDLLYSGANRTVYEIRRP